MHLTRLILVRNNQPQTCAAHAEEQGNTPATEHAHTPLNLQQPYTHGYTVQKPPNKA